MHDTPPDRMIPAKGRRGQLAVDICGADDGVPVILLHGTPGSRRGPRPRGVVLYRRGVRLISYDRPGFGSSTRAEGRTVAHAAADVEAIAEALGLDRFAVVGRSGGAPHALAVAALLPRQVTAAAALVSLAPKDAVGLHWENGMTRQNAEIYNLEADDLRKRLDEIAAQAHSDPQSLYDDLIDGGLMPEDLRVIGDVAIRRLLTMSYLEGLPEGRADGWVDDVLALRSAWGFDLSTIRVPTLLWHGTSDAFSPVEHTRWLAARVPTAETQEEVGVGHFRALEVLPSVLTWLVERHAETLAGNAPLRLAAVADRLRVPVA
jgi:pimeloyl-ACP methyl ester carboxylesterase